MFTSQSFVIRFSLSKLTFFSQTRCMGEGRMAECCTVGFGTRRCAVADSVQF